MKHEDPRMLQWMSPKELAAFFAISHRTVKRYRARGFLMLPNHRQTPSALMSWLCSQGMSRNPKCVPHRPYRSPAGTC